MYLMSVQRRPRTGKDKNGNVRWVGRYRDPGGKERSASFSTQREAKAWVEEKNREMRRGVWISPEDEATTLLDLAREWKAEATAPNTIANRKAFIDNLDELGNIPVGMIRPDHIVQWRNTLLDGRPWKKGKQSALAASTVAVMTGQVAGLLKRAEQDGYLVKTPRISAPKAPSRQALSRQNLLLPSEIGELVNLCFNGRPTTKGKRARTGLVPKRPWLGRIILLVSGSGLRVSEVAGLHPEDVDELHKVLHVQRQALPTGEGTGPVKNRKPRDVPLPDDVLDVLREQIRIASPAPGTPIFPREGGYHTRNSIGRTFTRLVDSWGGRECTFHDLRHYYASSLIAAGVPVNVVQQAMGHAQATTTLEVYAHLFPSADEVARCAAGAGFDLVRANCGQNADESAADELACRRSGRSGA